MGPHGYGNGEDAALFADHLRWRNNQQPQGGLLGYQPPPAVMDALRGGLMGLSTDVLGGPVDLMTTVLRPFGYSVQNPVGGSDWLAGIMGNAPSGTLPETVARNITGLLMPTPKSLDILGSIAGKIAGDIPQGFRMTSKAPDPNHDFDLAVSEKKTLDALSEMGFSVNRSKGSELSGSRYIYATAPDGNEVKIRISDHSLPASYKILNGVPDLEIGPHGDATFEEDAIVHLAKKFGISPPQYALDDVNQIEAARRLRYEGEKAIMARAKAEREWISANVPDYDSLSKAARKSARQRARKALEE